LLLRGLLRASIPHGQVFSPQPMRLHKVVFVFVTRRVSERGGQKHRKKLSDDSVHPRQLHVLAFPRGAPPPPTSSTKSGPARQCKKGTRNARPRRWGAAQRAGRRSNSVYFLIGFCSVGGIWRGGLSFSKIWAKLSWLALRGRRSWRAEGKIQVLKFVVYLGDGK